MLKASTPLPNFAEMDRHGQKLLGNGSQEETTQTGGACGQWERGRRNTGMRQKCPSLIPSGNRGKKTQRNPPLLAQ